MEEDKQLVEEGEIHEDDDDPDQDVPDNFFDDFNNEGFMESLQIVDSLDDGVEEPEVHDENEHVENNILKKSNDEKKTRKSEKSEKSRSKERKRRRESPRKKRKFDDTVLRRDPDKTRRDLEKDRVNFFKKKEQKVISKIIETGLVPPGMESEVNLSSIESERKIESEKSDQNKSDSNKIKSTPYKRSRERRSSVSKEMRISKERRNPISKERRSPDHRDRRSYISKDKRSPISKDRSPMSNDRKIRERRRNRSRSGSYGRYRSRSRERRRDRSPDLMRRRFRSSSRDRFDHLNRNKRRSRSISDRERWLRARDPSPEKKYEGLLKDKKISFLEEINMKLNGELGVARGDGVTYPQPKNPVQPPMVAPMPVAVPPPHFNQMYMMPQQSLVAPMNTTYNEEYFIGNQMMIPFKPNIPHMMPPLEHQSNLPVIQPTIPPGTPDMSHGGLEPPAEAVSSDTSEISARVSELIARISASTKSNLNQTGQLSQPVEKPLSLTDFLHINPAQECAPQPEALKKKIDVLSRCQDFLKEIAGDKKTDGKLRLNKSSHLINKPDQNVSPLLRQKPLKFSFNNPLSENSYQEILNRALLKTGIVSDVINLVDDDEEEKCPQKKKNYYKSPADKKKEHDDCTKSLMTMQKMCQTDPMNCEECERRENIQVRSIGIQCGESDRYNVGVQVVEEDIVNSNIPKNKSLAYLTPAQLLGRSDPVSSRVDNFSGSSSYREAINWSRSRDYYDDSLREYYGIRDSQRFPRF